VSATGNTACAQTKRLLDETGYTDDLADPVKLADVVSRIRSLPAVPADGKAGSQASFADYVAGRTIYSE
jgi:hypothetical protein